MYKKFFRSLTTKPQVMMRDDRGNTFPVPVREGRLISYREPDPRARKLQSARLAIHVYLREYGLRVGCIPFLSSIVGTVFLGGWILKRLSISGGFHATVICGVVIGIVAVIICMRRWTQPKLHARVKAIISQCRLCLSCAHDLRGQVAEEDGCTVCPACGCSMKLAAEIP